MKKPSTSSRPNIYQTVTDRILSSLKAGVIPWEKPWQTPHFTGGPLLALLSGKGMKLPVAVFTQDFQPLSPNVHADGPPPAGLEPPPLRRLPLGNSNDDFPSGGMS